MTKESCVHSFNGGKVLYVEPNDIYGYTHDDDGHVIPITPPYQDLCITFDLVADVYSRTNAGIRKASKTATEDSRMTSYVMSFHSKPRMESQTYLKGTGYGEYDKSKGKFEDYYLTTYYAKREFGAYIPDKQVIEGLGVESVQIDMEHWYTPTIVIKFVDVRGVALWGQEEAIRDDNGTISIENVFGSFFTLPYPVFHLTVKGFFGRPVTYQLSLSSFKGSYDMDGTFKVTATFIGYQYSLLTDIPMRYLVAAPFCEYEGKKYWDAHVDTPEWRLSDGNPPPKLYKFFEDVKGAVFVAPENETGNIPDTDIVTYEKQKNLLGDISRGMNEIRTTLAYNRKTIIENDDVTHNECIYFMAQPITVGATGRTGAVPLNLNGLKDVIVSLNKNINAYKASYGSLGGNFDKFCLMINNFVTGNVHENAGGVIYDGEYIGVFKYFSFDDEQMCITDLSDASIPKKSEILNGKIKEWFTKKDSMVSFNNNAMESLKYNINAERWKALKQAFYNEFIGDKNGGTSMQDVFIGMFDMYDVSYYVGQKLKNLDDEIKSIQQSIDKNRNFDILRAIGFRPYIGDFIKIIMCHLETFVHIVKQSEADAEIDKGKRKLKNASWTDWNDQLLNGGGTVPCWVGVTKTETDLAKYDENGNNPTEGHVSWLGAFEDVDENGASTENFVETRVVNSLLKAMACTMTTPDEPKEIINDANLLSGYNFFPILPFDFKNPENMYASAMTEMNDGNSLQKLIGFIGIRICQIANSLKSSQNALRILREMAQLDAYNWYKACQNGTKLAEFIYEPLKTLENGGNVEDIIYGILSGDPQYKETYKNENINGSKSYPFQIIKGDEEHYMFKPWEKNGNFVVASYINADGVQITPTKIKGFNLYRYSPGNENPIMYYDDDKVRPYFKTLNSKGERLACDWVAPYKMYDSTDTIISNLYKDTYNSDLYAIFDDSSVRGGIMAKFWQLKDKKRLNVSEEYANERPNYDEYLKFMYSNFDNGYQMWYSDQVDGTFGQFIVSSSAELKGTEVNHEKKYSVGKNELEFKKKRLKVRSLSTADVDPTMDVEMIPNNLVFEDIASEQDKLTKKPVTYGELFMPSCPIYTGNGNHTNIFLHTSYYNTPFKYFNEDVTKFSELDNNENIKLRILFRCAMFLFTFQYGMWNIKNNPLAQQTNFAYSGLKRMPKGLILQLGAMVWWKRTFDHISQDKYSKNLNSDMPRYSGTRVLFPFEWKKDCVGQNNASEVDMTYYRFTYYAKGQETGKYMTYEHSPLYHFTKGDLMLENMLYNRFVEFALTDKLSNGELEFATIREALEIRIDTYAFDSICEKNYVQAGLIHGSGYTVLERLGEIADAKSHLDWNHFNKYYGDIFVDETDLDGFFKYDGAMTNIQSMLKNIYFDDWILMTTIAKHDGTMDVERVTDSILNITEIKHYISCLYHTLGDIVEKTSSKMNVAYLSKMEGISGATHNELEPIQVGVYNYIKNLYDKWLLQVDEKMFSVTNFYKPNFYFMTSYYENLYNKLVVNCETVTDLYRKMAYEQSLWNYLDHVISEHNCQWYITPDFIPFGQNLKENKEMLYDVFKPYSYHDLSLNTHYNGQNMASYANCNRFIAVLKSEIPNTIAPPTYTEYKQDGFTMVQSIGQRDENGNPVYEGTDDLSNIFPTRKAELLNDKTEYNELRDNSVWDGAVPCFGVTMTRQNQHLFENVDVNMENPIVTDISARTYEDIVNVGKTGERRVYFHGQDIYKVYSAYSYGCKVTMLGDAQIQPLMYFQLNNIPMWHGAYLIYKVSHVLTVGDMKTTFEGQRVSRRRAMINQQFATGASLLDYSVGDGVEKSTIVGKVTIDTKTLNDLNHKIEVKPYRDADSPFKMQRYHQGSTWQEALSDDPKYFKVLEDAFNEMVQLNSLEGFGHTIRISSMYRVSNGSSDHSNPVPYKQRNCAMDIQVTSAGPQRDHKISLIATYLLYLLKRGNVRQLLLEIGKPKEKDNMQYLQGDDTYLHCFHVSLMDEKIPPHTLPFGFMLWTQGENGKYNWHNHKYKVGELPPTIAKVFLLYLDYCKEKNILSTFKRITNNAIDFEVPFDYQAYKSKLEKTILAATNDTYSRNAVLDDMLKL